MFGAGKEAWIAFVAVVPSSYEKFVPCTVNQFSFTGHYVLSANEHCLFRHLDYFFENQKVMRDEQRENFHQDIEDMETKYQGRWSTNVMLFTVAHCKEIDKTQFIHMQQRRENSLLK